MTPYAFQFDLRAPKSQPGCEDFCFIWSDTLQKLQNFLSDLKISIELGPVTRTGGRAAGTVTGQSVHIRDPDTKPTGIYCLSGQFITSTPDKHSFQDAALPHATLPDGNIAHIWHLQGLNMLFLRICYFLMMASHFPVQPNESCHLPPPFPTSNLPL